MHNMNLFLELSISSWTVIEFIPIRIELNLEMTALIHTRAELSLELIAFVPGLTALIPRKSG